MPCSAPCNRLPCDVRCTKLLPCGHQCPGLCGEECPVDICQDCKMRADEEPDVLLGLPYRDIDLNDTPIVVLGCKGRHFFTVETLDGTFGMQDVYEVDAKTGEYIALKDDEQLRDSVPRCPSCNDPVRQYVTQRYNRVVNLSVIDEMSKRFIVSGQRELQELFHKLQGVEQSLEATRATQLAQDAAKKISNRYVKASDLEKDARTFLRKMDERHKPSHKLHEAVVHAAGKHAELSDSMAQMILDPSNAGKKQDRDQRITLGGRLYHLKVRQLILNDKFEGFRGYKSRSGCSDLSFPGGSPTERSGSFLRDCEIFIKDCKNAHSPKLAVEATLQYAHVAFLFGSSGAIRDTDRPQATQYRETASGLLDEAEKLCENAFQDRDKLKQGIERALQMLGREFYEEVTKEEIEAVKRAMVSGRGGIASHSGHWYNCANGHPVSLSRWFIRTVTDYCSLLLVSVECRWSSLSALNVVPRSVVRAIGRSKE